MAAEELVPSRTYFLARLPSGMERADIVSDLLDYFQRRHIEDPSDRRASGRRRISQTIEPYVDMEVGVLTYVEWRTPSWTTDPSLTDKVNQLVLVARYREMIAVHASDTSMRDDLVKVVKTRQGTVGFAVLVLLSPGLLYAAFTDGIPKTAWLTGTHYKTSLKPDGKTISSQNLRDCLDPIEDQSYTVRASRWRSRVGPLRELSVTITPRDARIYCAGRPTSLADWLRDTRELMRAVAAADEELLEPLPVVASAAPDATEVGEPIDMGLHPPELSREDPSCSPVLEAEKDEVVHSLSFQDAFQVGRELFATMYWTDSVEGKREHLGEVSVRLDLRNPQRVKLCPDPAFYNHVDGITRAKVRHCLGETDLLTIHYDSGHTIVNNELVLRRYRDFPFNDFRWADFEFANLLKEKPGILGLETLGRGGSLFCWVVRNWPNLDGEDDQPGGWLACDDGQGEIADFVHLDDESQPPVLSFIHVKAAASGSARREVSVTAFEVVVSQAVKSIRRLDEDLLRDGLTSTSRPWNKDLVWHDREPATRDEMLHAFDKVKSELQRQVVIVQPHLCKSAHDAARQDSSDQGNRLRIRQIDTLLYSTAASSQSMGARLVVVAAGAY